MTNAEREHLDLVAQIPCLCCGNPHVQVHHAIHGRYSQKRVSHFETIPLCARHHAKLHHRPAAWKAMYGLDVDMLPIVEQKIAEIKRNTV